MNNNASNSEGRPHWLLRSFLRVVLGCSLLPCATYGQTTPSQSDQLATAIARVESGKGDGRDVEIIALAKALQAVQALEVQFPRATDVSLKCHIANALVRLGDKDDTYWDYLLGQATLAVDSGIPDAVFDSEGKPRKQPYEDIKPWAEAHHVSVEKAAEYAMYDFPGIVMLLGQTGDRRGIPLLRRALNSHNLLIAATAAKGLAQAQDNEAVPLIIAACQGPPGGARSALAMSLIYFDDPRAQRAVDIYLPKEMAKTFREARAHGMGPFGYEGSRGY